MQEPIKIALLGFGTIGSSLGRIISKDGIRRQEQLKSNPTSVSSIADILAHLEIVSILTLEVEDVKSTLQKPEFAGIANAKVTTDFNQAIGENPDIIVELIGGVNPAYNFIKQAIAAKKHVVTANKAVLGVHGQELRSLAKEQGVELLYEASVGGAVPIVRAIRHSLMGDKIISITGVLNGTTNFILDKMTREGVSYEDALREAQNLGFAEADPSADVNGFDPAAKIAILASLAFGRDLKMSDVSVSGITQITQGDIIAAKTNGQVYKLVATATREGCASGNDNITLGVSPQLVPEKSAFGELAGSMNAVEVISEYSTKLTFFGPGAGGNPTASAVLADIIEIANRL